MVQCFPYCTKTVETGMLTILQFGHSSFCGIWREKSAKMRESAKMTRMPMWHEKSIKPQIFINRLFQNTERNVLIVDV